MDSGKEVRSMKRRITTMLIVLAMLLGMMPGMAYADDYTFEVKEGLIHGLQGGKAVTGTTISFDPEALFNESMIARYNEIGDFVLAIEDDKCLIESLYCTIDPDGFYRKDIPESRDVAGDVFWIVIEIDGYEYRSKNGIPIVVDLSKHSDILDCNEPRVYSGKAQTQPISVFYQSVGIDEGTDYTVSYKNNINAGTAYLTVTGKGGFIGSITRSFRIDKAANTMTAQGKTVKVKKAKVARKKQTIKPAKYLTIRNARGKLAYKLTGVNKKKFKKFFKVNAKNGNITVKKGLKKGKYTLTIDVTASGNANYLPATKQVTVTVRVK